MVTATAFREESYTLDDCTHEIFAVDFAGEDGEMYGLFQKGERQEGTCEEGEGDNVEIYTVSFTKNAEPSDENTDDSGE